MSRDDHVIALAIAILDEALPPVEVADDGALELGGHAHLRSEPTVAPQECYFNIRTRLLQLHHEACMAQLVSLRQYLQGLLLESNDWHVASHRVYGVVDATYLHIHDGLQDDRCSLGVCSLEGVHSRNLEGQFTGVNRVRSAIGQRYAHALARRMSAAY